MPQVNQGSLYPALYRLEDRGWVEAEWGISPEGRRAKFYTLTAAGRRHLAEEAQLVEAYPENNAACVLFVAADIAAWWPARDD